MTTEDRPETPPVYLYWSEFDTSATVKGWGGDNIYKCSACPEWQGDGIEAGERHSRLHEREAAAPAGTETLIDAANAVLFAARKRPVTQEEERALAYLEEQADKAGHSLASPEPTPDSGTDEQWYEFVNLVWSLIPDGDVRGSIIGAAARLTPSAVTGYVNPDGSGKGNWYLIEICPQQGRKSPNG